MPQRTIMDDKDNTHHLENALNESLIYPQHVRGSIQDGHYASALALALASKRSIENALALAETIIKELEEKNEN